MWFRALTVVDVFSREALAIEVGRRLGGEHVVAVLNRLAAQRKPSGYLFVGNGSEFPGPLLDLWAYHHKIKINFSRLENRQIIATLRTLADRSGTNVCTRIGLNQSMRLRRSTKRGGAITTRVDSTCLSLTLHHTNSPFNGVFAPC